MFGITRALPNDPGIQVLDRHAWFFALLSIVGVAPIGYLVGGWHGRPARSCSPAWSGSS